MAYLIKPDRAYCEEIGLPSYGYIPGIWSKDWAPVTEAIDYLIARGSRRWTSEGQKSGYAASKPLAENSMMAFGLDLTNFLDWCERRHVKWQVLSYYQLVKDYQGDMTSGKWAQTHKGMSLSASTINRRVLTASDFLRFAAHLGYREPFKIEYTSVPDPRKTSRYASTAQRVGKVRENPIHLNLPTLDELKIWLDDLLKKHGRTPHLMAKTAIGVGFRAEELLLIRVGQIPKLPTDHRKTVRMPVCFGTKGDRDPADIEKRGKLRYVEVPVSLLDDWHRYITGHRKLCLSKFKKLYPGAAEPKQLFLSKYTGRPYGYDRFYELWKSPASLPFKEFSPHVGRHTWACYTLIERMKEERELSVGADGPLTAFAAGLHESLIKVWISSQLGHVNERTSGEYLRLVMTQLGPEDYVAGWWDYLNG